MKSYRTWEVNRKIWLYPENWILPELRDDKSPFFRELENELLQSNLDNAAAEAALGHYLEKLEQVAHLEAAGMFEEGDGTLHVFGRTFHTPRAYFYRRRDGATGAWTPWESVDLDIGGDHLIPVVWNTRLMLIWPMFNQAQDQQNVKLPAPGQNVGSKPKHWEMQLAWSEYRNGGWSGKNLSDSVRLDAIYGQSNILFGDYVPPPEVSGGFARMSPNVPLPPPNLPSPPPDAPQISFSAQFNGSGDDVPQLIPEALFSFKTLVNPAMLTVRAYLRLDYDRTDPSVNAAIAYPFGEFLLLRLPQDRQHSAPLANGRHGFRPGAEGHRLRGQLVPAVRLRFHHAGRRLRPSWLRHHTADHSCHRERAGAAAARRFGNDCTAHRSAGAGKRGLAFQAAAPAPGCAVHRKPPVLLHGPAPGILGYVDGLVAYHSGSGGLGDRRSLDARRGELEQPVNSSGIKPSEPPKFTVLLLATGGLRVARQLTAVNLNPVSEVLRFRTRFWSNRAYTFRNFHHPYVCAFLERLSQGGIGALLSNDSQNQAAQASFGGYAATGRVAQAYPIDEVEFKPGGAYDIYNWELFFHIPLLIATRLEREPALRRSAALVPLHLRPDRAAGGACRGATGRPSRSSRGCAATTSSSRSTRSSRSAASGAPAELAPPSTQWRQNPFHPHVVARLRTTAYQKAVVMKYLDNLIAWGDQLFRKDTIETINEATQLYVLAAEILGRRPEIIAPAARPRCETFDSWSRGSTRSATRSWRSRLSSPATRRRRADRRRLGAMRPCRRLPYFCVPRTTSCSATGTRSRDRLFKIRHCMNIEGPGAPAAAVRAADRSGAAGARAGCRAQHRRGAQRHIRVVAEPALQRSCKRPTKWPPRCRNLGAALIAALEKRDTEALSALRSGQELRMLQAIPRCAREAGRRGQRQHSSPSKGRGNGTSQGGLFQSRPFENDEGALGETSLILSTIFGATG